MDSRYSLDLFAKVGDKEVSEKKFDYRIIRYGLNKLVIYPDEPKLKFGTYYLCVHNSFAYASSQLAIKM